MNCGQLVQLQPWALRLALGAKIEIELNNRKHKRELRGFKKTVISLLFGQTGELSCINFETSSRSELFQAIIWQAGISLSAIR